MPYLCRKIGKMADMENNNVHARDLRTLSLTHRRSKFIDYKGRGIYLITLCTEHRRPLLGELCGDGHDSAYIRPSELGQAVLRCWQDIPALQRELAAQKAQRLGTTCTRDIQLLSCQLMPDHFHGIIFIRQNMDIALGQVVRGFMMGCTQAYHEMMKSAFMPTVQRLRSAGGIHTASLSANLPTHPLPLQPLWEKGYHDRPLRRSGQLQNMLSYLTDNPRRLYMRRHHAQYFHATKGVRVGRFTLNAVGNLLLLDNPMHVVHVRRRFTESERRRYMNDCVLAARQGKVLISPFISEYEKQVRDVVLREGYGVIQLTSEVFSQYYKPSGDLFDACSRGQLLLLSANDTPASFSTRITRNTCVALNALAEEVCGGSSC